ncbi:hypothetical protein [Escherichia coli]|uniref:hypothetical protein n=1 Tax=Escherichia coli TaxID=562 RepID=UPI00388FDBA0
MHWFGRLVNVDHPLTGRSGKKKPRSIQVAVIQLANTCVARQSAVMRLDNIGLTSPLMLSGTMMLTALWSTAKVKMK